MSKPDQPTVVVGIDDTEAARAALRWAVHQAEATRSVVAAVAVWHQPTAMTAGTADMIAPIVDDADLEAQAQRWLSDAIAELPGGTDQLVHEEVLSGEPTDTLLERAREAELLVLGNHRHGRLAGAVIGSVALACTHRADCPVVLVPS